MKMKVTINLNEYVKFKLTDYGKDIYYHQYDDLIKRIPNCTIKPHMPKTDAEGYTEMQLWCFIELYGPYMHMGNQSILKPNEIIYNWNGEER